jgi:tRNA threonylcarbamoyladenosine biosynthesis protein TsaB
MSLVLNIDTALNQGSVCLSRDGVPLQLIIQEEKKDQAAWLHAAIAAMLREHNVQPADLQAVAVSIGPGSYTGLRVGLSAAKGFCYALGIPLITISTLKIIAFAVKDDATAFICPMIDARRLEVFTSLYDSSMREIISPRAMIIDENSLELFPKAPIVFCGNGSSKLRALVKSELAQFNDTACNAGHLALLSASAFQNKEFADLAYSEPFYLKEFYSPIHKS